MNRQQAKERSRKNSASTLCECLEDVLCEIASNCDLGITNCDVKISEKYLFKIKEKLLSDKYGVFSTCTTNYSAEEQFHELDIHWH
ncbi:hypothetical protein N9948_00835 [bacterium]|nr:hypothetical protein [bacterium]